MRRFLPALSLPLLLAGSHPASAQVVVAPAVRGAPLSLPAPAAGLSFPRSSPTPGFAALGPAPAFPLPATLASPAVVLQSLRSGAQAVPAVPAAPLSAAPGSALPAAPAPADLALAREAVRAIRKSHPRSPSAIRMIMLGIEPGSRKAKLLPRLQAYYDAALKDLIALREEFGKEFSWGRHHTVEELAGRMRDLVAKYDAANCMEEALLAQAYLRARGIRAHIVVFETFDWWTRQKDPDRNHVFVVFGVPEGANPAVPAQWGPGAVIADAWGNVAGPAGETLDHLLDDVFRLERDHQVPSFFVLDYESL